MDEEGAATLIQSLYRTRRSRHLLKLLLQATVEKVYDEETGLFFYYNTKTHESAWEKPGLLLEEEVLTPRQRAKLKIKVDKKIDGREKTSYNMSKDDAALSIQGLFRTAKAKAKMIRLCATVYEKLYDPDSAEYFYYNKNTDESSWFKPIILGSNDLEETEGRDDVYLLTSRIPAFENILKRNQREFVEFLTEHGFDHLYQSLVEEGFDDLEALCAMQEEDYELVGIKTSQREKMQSAIRSVRERRGIVLRNLNLEVQLEEESEEKEPNADSDVELESRRIKFLESSSEEEQEENDEEEEQSGEEETESEISSITSDSGFVMNSIFPGDGKIFPKKGMFARVHFVGKLNDGRVFESSRRRKRPFEFKVGAGHVIPGWDAAIRRMSVGERAVVHISPELGYGPEGRSPLVPPNADLEFEIELISTYFGKIGVLDEQEEQRKALQQKDETT